MSSQRQRITLLAGLMVVMAAVYARAYWRAPSSSAARSPSAAPGAQDTDRADGSTASSAAEKLSTAPSPVIELALPPRPGSRDAQRRRAALLGWGRDPFSRAAASPSEPEGLVLSGILWDEAAPMAIINGQLLHIGEECEGYRIVAITQERVSVTDGTDIFQLFIVP